MKFFRCFLYLFGLGVFSFLAGRITPKSCFDSKKFPYQSFRFEKNGAIYESLSIRKWQKKVPDMSKWFPRLIPKKQLPSDPFAALPSMITETCIAEITHVFLAVAALYCLALWPGLGGVIVTLLYEIFNLPYILIQRYNRPRLLALAERYERRRRETPIGGEEEEPVGA